MPHGAASWSVARPASHLASALLRLQRMGRTQADRETRLHAPQSGSAWIGGIARAVALEQFPLVSLRRGRPVRMNDTDILRMRVGGLRIAADCGAAVGSQVSQNRRDPGHPRSTGTRLWRGYISSPRPRPSALGGTTQSLPSNGTDIMPACRH